MFKKIRIFLEMCKLVKENDYYMKKYKRLTKELKPEDDDFREVATEALGYLQKGISNDKRFDELKKEFMMF